MTIGHDRGIRYISFSSPFQPLISSSLLHFALPSGRSQVKTDTEASEEQKAKEHRVLHLLDCYADLVAVPWVDRVGRPFAPEDDEDEDDEGEADDLEPAAPSSAQPQPQAHPSSARKTPTKLQGAGVPNSSNTSRPPTSRGSATPPSAARGGEADDGGGSDGGDSEAGGSPRHGSYVSSSAGTDSDSTDALSGDEGEFKV